MRSADNPSVESSRYAKFGWDDLTKLPPLGKAVYYPQGGLTAVYQSGEFHGEHLFSFPAVKQKHKLTAVGRCIYCGLNKGADGTALTLTSEHVIPEFLGSGLELPEASCHTCQATTAAFESSIASEMFDPVRKSFSLVGKNGVKKGSNFPADIARLTTEKHFIPLADHPTILVLPTLFPASSYSSRRIDSNGLYGMMFFNINASDEKLYKYDIAEISTQSVDLPRFCQMIAKIAFSYTVGYMGYDKFTPTIGPFISTAIPPLQVSVSHYNNVGCIGRETKDTDALHEIEVGKIKYGESTIVAARVRLFSSYGMPSYYVSLGTPNDS